MNQSQSECGQCGKAFGRDPVLFRESSHAECIKHKAEETKPRLEKRSSDGLKVTLGDFLASKIAVKKVK